MSRTRVQLIPSVPQVLPGSQSRKTRAFLHLSQQVISLLVDHSPIINELSMPILNPPKKKKMAITTTPCGSYPVDVCHSFTAPQFYRWSKFLASQKQRFQFESIHNFIVFSHTLFFCAGFFPMVFFLFKQPSFASKYSLPSVTLFPFLKIGNSYTSGIQTF